MTLREGIYIPLGNQAGGVSLSGNWNTPAFAPSVVSAQMVNCWTFRVDYDMEVKHVSSANADDCLNPFNYAFTGPTSIVPMGVVLKQANPTVVWVTCWNIGGVIYGIANYTVTVSNVENLTGTVIDPAHDDASFNGANCADLSGVGGGGIGGGGDGGAAGPGAGGGGGVGGGGEIIYPGWKSSTLAKIIPDAVGDAAGIISDAISPIQAALTAISEVLNAIAAFLTGPVLNVVEAIKAAIIEIRAMIYGTGFYYLSMWDHGLRQIQIEVATVRSTIRNVDQVGVLEAIKTLQVGSKVTFKDFLTRMSNTFDDQGDTDRPQMTGSCAAFTMAVAAPDIGDLLNLLKSLSAVFPTLKELQAIADSMDTVTKAPVVRTYSAPPDWDNATTGDFLHEFLPGLANTIDDVFWKLIAILDTAKDIAEGLAKLAKLISRKVQMLSDLLEQLNSIAELLAALENAGFYCLFLETNAGVSDLRKQLINSRNQPFGTMPVYVSGAMIMVGTGSITVFKKLFSEGIYANGTDVPAIT